jgi:hypothetical protein
LEKKIYKFPKELAAQIAFETVYKFVMEQPYFEKIVFVCFDDENYKYANNQMQKLKLSRIIFQLGLMATYLIVFLHIIGIVGDNA